jgi:hypothetical protein
LSDSFLRRSFSFISPSVASAVAVVADVVPIPAFDPPPPRPSGDPPSPWLPLPLPLLPAGPLPRSRRPPIELIDEWLQVVVIGARPASASFYSGKI